MMTTPPLPAPRRPDLDPVDAVLRAGYADLVGDLRGTLDLTAGAAEAAEPDSYQALTDDLAHHLDLERGLAAITGGTSMRERGPAAPGDVVDTSSDPHDESQLAVRQHRALDSAPTFPPQAVRLAGTATSDPVGPHDHRSRLLDALRALEGGDWRRVLRDVEAMSGTAHDGIRLRSTVLLNLVAHSMRLQAQGRPLDAWDRLDEAASLLPPGHRRPDTAEGGSLALLTPAPPRVAPVEQELAWRSARLVWREQHELAELRHKFGNDATRPRDELVEAFIEHLSWVEFDPWTYRTVPPSPAWADGPTVEDFRSTLCMRADLLREFANPAARVSVSKAAWQDIGGYRGLRAAALAELARRAAPTPGSVTGRATDIPVRRGRARAWEYARRGRGELVGT